MAKRQFKAGSTDQTVDIFVQDSSSTTGDGLTGLAYNTASLTCYYRKGATGTATALSLATQTVGGAHSDGGFVQIDSTNMPGVYRLDLSDTMLATAGWVTIYLRGATNMAPCVMELEIVSYDPFDAVRLGLTALPNANAAASNGLLTSGTGSHQISTNSGQMLVQSGTGTGQLDFTSGVVKASLVQLLGSAITGTASQLAAAFTKFFNVSTPTGTVNSLPDAVPGASGGLFIAGTNASCTITGNLLVQGGITVTQSSSNQPAIIATGNGTGQGARFVGGNGAAGVDIAGTGAASGLTIGAGTGAGTGLAIVGGGTSGVGISITTTSGDGISITPTAGHGVVVTANGSSKHGMQITGGTSGTSDGVKFVAGSGGVSFNATLSTVTNVTNAPTSGDLTATMKASLADAVWDEAKSGHVTAGTFGEGASDWASQTALADIATDVQTLGDTAATILGDTNELQTDWANGGRLDVILDARASQTSVDTLAGYVDTEVASIISTLSTIAGYLDTEIAAILADTNELQTDWANGGRLDLMLDAILADTGTDGVVLSAAMMNKIADHVRRRTQANVEASSDGDTLSLKSQYGAIQQMQNSNTTDEAGKITVKKTNGDSLGTLTLSTDAGAEPVDGVS